MILILIQSLFLGLNLLTKFVLIPNYLKYLNVTFIILLLGIVILSWFLLGISKKHNKLKTSTIQTVVIYVLLFLLLYNLSGLLIGFVRSPYTLTIANIIQNTIPVILIIVLEELLRHSIVNHKQKTIIIVTTIVLFVFSDMVNYSWMVTDGTDLFELVGLYLLPSISKNILLTYLVLKVGYEASIIYRIFTELSIYFIIVSPNFSVYLDSLIHFLLPLGLLYKVYRNHEHYEVRQPTRIKKRYVLILPLTIILAIVISLTAGLFKYQSVVIMSDSMMPVFARGDVVIHDQKPKEIKEEDIIVFTNEEKLVVHRVNKVITKNNSIFYQTKGDNNNDVDSTLIAEDQVKGVVKLVLPHVGKPTVWLNEKFGQ